MGLLDGKVALVFGVANKNSIAWGIVKRLHEQGATVALSYAGEALKKRVMPLAESLGIDFVEECDVTSDEALDNVFAKVADRFGKIDILVHSVAFANREDLGGRFVDVSREGFKLALDISAYSLIAMARRAEPLMPDGGSIMSLSYFAAEKVMPKYNVMAIAKSALEAITRYLAADLGPSGIRVNSISAGPVNTLSARGVPGFSTMYKYFQQAAPLRQPISQEDVGDAAVWLGSDLSRRVTGEVIYVDSGYHVLGLTATEEDMQAMKGG